MNDYTPTTSEVRIKYKLASRVGDEGFAEFDRWLAEYVRDREQLAVAEAVINTVDTLLGVYGYSHIDPVRDVIASYSLREDLDLK